MNYQTEFQKWLSSPALSSSERAELESIQGNDKEIESRFFAPLEFGTAGLRGTMGMGTYRMNIYVVRQFTQAFANVIIAEGGDAPSKGVCVCYDSRNNSELFARETACVLAGNGISVRLFDALRPTPELSFAIREYNAQAGVNITASHNPKEYNGYKVYWSDGAQLPPEHASQVSKQSEKIDPFRGIISSNYDEALKSGKITIMGKETDKSFLDNVCCQSVAGDSVKKMANKLEIIYTPFHGTGHKLVPEALKRVGFKKVSCVPEQMVIDGNFPTVKSPNPEDKEGFELAINLAKEKNASLIIGTDPDADRVGVVIRDSSGEYITLSGNQTGVLLLDFIIKAKTKSGSLPRNAAALKTIVSTEFARAVAESQGVSLFDTFTGFKFLAEKIKTFEDSGSHQYIFAFEESYGYLVGDHARDKDAVVASMLIAEMAAFYAEQGKTLYDALNELYARYGFFIEKTLNLQFPGVEGLANMKNLMTRLRKEPPATLCDAKVLAVRDYLDGTRKAGGKTEKMELKGSNVLYWELEDGTSFIIRPSGTEPKIKVYILTSGKFKLDSDRKIALYSEYAKSLA